MLMRTHQWHDEGLSSSCLCRSEVSKVSCIIQSRYYFLIEVPQYYITFSHVMRTPSSFFVFPLMESVDAFQHSTVKSLPFEVLIPREVMPELFHGHSPRSVRADGNCAFHCQNRPWSVRAVVDCADCRTGRWFAPETEDPCSRAHVRTQHSSLPKSWALCHKEQTTLTQRADHLALKTLCLCSKDPMSPPLRPTTKKTPSILHNRQKDQ